MEGEKGKMKEEEKRGRMSTRIYRRLPLFFYCLSLLFLLLHKDIEKENDEYEEDRNNVFSFFF